MEKIELQQAPNLDNMIMDIEVGLTKDDKVRIKFVAFVGGNGPELIMPKNMACDLHEKLGNLKW